MPPLIKPSRKRLLFDDPSKVAERIKRDLDLVDVMEEAGVVFAQSTERSAKASCFAHQDDTPSLVVNRDKQLFNCFGAGCEMGGDLVAFWMQYHNLDFFGACYDLIERHKIDVSDLTRKPTAEELERERLIAINNRVAEALHEKAQASQKIQVYLKERGLIVAGGEDALDGFLLGFSQVPQELTKLQSKLGIRDADFELLQLDSRELFTNRLLYPIIDGNGDVLSFFGRTLFEDHVKYIGMRSEHKDTGKKHPLLSSDVPYGLFQAHSHVRDAGGLILVEGFNDVIVAHVNGLQNVAGMCGAMPSPKMYQYLKNHNVNSITICPDGDDAGFRTVDTVSKNRAKHQQVKIMTLPSGMDPDEFITEHGMEAFKERLGEAVYPVEIIIRHAAQKLMEKENISSRLDVTRDLADHINVLSGFEREFAMQELATMTEMDRSQLESLVSSSGGAEFSDIGLESKLMGECIKDRGKAINALSILRPEDFVTIRHYNWWKLLRQMIADDIETFSREMFITYAVDKSVLHQDDVEVVPKEGLGSVGVDYAARRLLDMSHRRRLNKTGGDFINALQNPKKTVEEALNDHMRTVSQSVVNERAVTTAAEHVIKAMDTIHERMANPGIPGLDIGPNWRRLMSQIMGFQPGHMISVAAISKAGKTTIAQNWCIEQLKHCCEPTLWINLEMSDLDLTLRNLSIMTGIPNQRLKIGNITKEEKASLDDASALYHSFPLYVASMAGASVFDVVNTMRKYVYSNGVKVVFIDYIQLISSASKNDRASLWEAQNEVVLGIRQAISTLGVTGVVISQLNRGAMAEGSASGQFVAGTIKLIQDSDVFMGLRRKTKEELAENPHSNASLVVEFNRHGPQETIIDLDFRNECLQMSEV